MSKYERIAKLNQEAAALYKLADGIELNKPLTLGYEGRHEHFKEEELVSKIVRPVLIKALDKRIREIEGLIFDELKESR